MTDNTRSPQLTLEEIERQMVELVNKLAPRNLQADAVVCPCESEHRPVYPVRYAYSNLYGSIPISSKTVPTLNETLNPPSDIEVFFSLVKESIPENILQMMNAKTIEESYGYSARLLREGWIYVFEDDDFYHTREFKNGRLLIFKHNVEINTTSDGSTGREEFFSYEGKISPKGKLEIIDNSRSYPYMPICKDVMNISIVFSEVKLSNYVVKKMIKDADYRKKFMQQANIVHFENNENCVEASAENLEKFVDDYKKESLKFKNFIQKIENKEVLPDFFSDISSAPDVPSEVSLLVNQFKRALDDEEKATLIILHDPVGYHKDILAFHDTLVSIQYAYSEYFSHPYKIGSYINQLKKECDDMVEGKAKEELNDILNDSIDFEEFNKYWPMIQKYVDIIESQLHYLIKIYEKFKTSQEIINRKGGLKHYFDYAFLVRENIQKDTTEISIESFKDICHSLDVYISLLSPLSTSRAGRLLLNKIYSLQNDKKDDLFLSMMTRFVVLASNSAVARGAKNIPLVLANNQEYLQHVANKMTLFAWDALAYSFTKTHPAYKKYEMENRHISVKGIKFLAHKLLNAVLNVYGAKVSLTDVSSVTGSDFKDLVRKSKLDRIVTDKINLHKMFDWPNRYQAQGTAHLIASPKIDIYNETVGGYLALGKSKANIVLPAISFLASAIQYKSLLCMSQYDEVDPLKKSAVNFYLFQEVSNLIVASDSLASAILNWKKVTINFFPETNPSLKSIGTAVKTIFSKGGLRNALTPKGISKVIALKGLTRIAALASVALSVRDAFEAYYIGNVGRTVGHGMEAVGGVLLALPLFFAFNPVGLVILVAAGILLLVSGLFVSKAYEWTTLEKLLRHCFWGNEIKSLFWNEKKSKSILANLKNYTNSYENMKPFTKMEEQEFKNFFFTAQLKKNYIKNHEYVKLDFSFYNFIPGVSEVHFELVKKEGYNRESNNPILARNNYTILPEEYLSFFGWEKLHFQLKNAARNGLFNKASGAYEFSLEVKTQLLHETKSGILVSKRDIPDIYWYYEVNPDTVVPMRYIDSQKTLDEANSVLGFINEEKI
ncbi:toxin VasX [Providencia manganoxydans]|uniref:toxin VasX n=1 Tax=Providencia manganoxydans TaxID=2923283 RepID=UPI0034DD8AB4